MALCVLLWFDEKVWNNDKVLYFCSVNLWEVRTVWRKLREIEQDLLTKPNESYLEINHHLLIFTWNFSRSGSLIQMDDRLTLKRFWQNVLLIWRRFAMAKACFIFKFSWTNDVTDLLKFTSNWLLFSLTILFLIQFFNLFRIVWTPIFLFVVFMRHLLSDLALFSTEIHHRFNVFGVF